jgi:hypothetical protein
MKKKESYFFLYHFFCINNAYMDSTWGSVESGQVNPSPPPPHRRKEEEEESMLLSNKDYQFALDRMSCIHNHCRSTGTSQTFLSCHMSSPEIKFKDKRVGTERLARIR